MIERRQADTVVTRRAVHGSDGLAERDWAMTIGHELVHAEGGATLDVVDPSSGQVITQIPAASERDVDRAVAAARRAYLEWRTLPLAERTQFVWQLADAVEAHAEELAWLDTIDNGSPIKVMRSDAPLAVAQLRHMAGLAPTLRGAVIATPERSSLDYTVHDPFGVVARIVPFNHPLMFAASKLGAPLIAGNTVVLKPSQHTSLSALRLGELCAQTLPPGVVNVLSGRGSTIGDHLVRHADVPRIAFTGSVEVGLRIQREAARQRVKVVTLELGGKNPIIVFPDSPREKAVEGVLRGMNFSWQGQSCGSTSRLYVQRSIFEDFVAELGSRMDALTVGDPRLATSDVGAIVSRDQHRSVVGYIRRGLAQADVRVVAGGLPEDADDPRYGFYIRPTLFAYDADSEFALAREEIFGPVLVASPFDTEEQVVASANELPFGLTASVWTEDLGRAMRLTRDIESGYVWVNWSSSHIPGAPFGGIKDSGVGREEGIEEIYSYTQSKNVYIRFGT
jgi:betaine-aldehyde dehydrogenase